MGASWRGATRAGQEPRAESSAGSGALAIALIMATASAPASRIAGAASGPMPPMATIGMRIAARTVYGLRACAA